MRILVVGSGGREHALVWKLAQSPHVTQMWCAPGNAGLAHERLVKNGSSVQSVPIQADDLDGLLAFAREQRPDLTVVGPDNPLALGIVDLFTKERFRIWGPSQRAARFESSKAYAQEFMERHGIPTARSGNFTDRELARRFATALDGRCAVKADGLALGKGVFVCASVEQAYQAIDDLLVSKSLGAAGARVVIQEFLQGTEISLHALCDGRATSLFPTAQDHKAVRDGDSGPNTGGMGTYSPTPFLQEAELQQIRTQLLDRWMKGCAEEGIDFRGILYPGLMLTESGPKVLEFNARFGDPETQVYMARLESDLVELLNACVDGTLAQTPMKWSPRVAVCVVMASGGYPGTYAKHKPISGLDEAAKLPDTKVFHAGTAEIGGRTVTNGGRVLGVTAWGTSLSEAQNRAYAAVEKIRFDGAHFRRDIAAKALRARS